MNEYEAFLESKSQRGEKSGFKPVWIPDFLFDFQKFLTEWSILQGRGYLWEDCGLGKTPQGLVWAENVVRHTNGKVLAVAPLGVAPQIIRESDKFSVETHRSRDGKPRPNITVTNIQRLHLFDPNDYAGLWLDEASCIKAETGATRAALTAFLRKMPYRLFTSATAAPNDYVEFGTASEALGYLGYQDMLSTFFTTNENSLHPVWQKAAFKFKAHAEEFFWKWLCSWGRALRRPSDIGFDDGPFILPPLNLVETIVERRNPPTDCLFAMPATTLEEQRKERKETLDERCEEVARLCESHPMSIAWATSNEDGVLLQKLIPGSVEVAGRHDDDYKEEALRAFSEGEITKLVTKDKIAGWGMNFQKCAHMTRFPEHSFEGYYQAVRRCWRFGQAKPVRVDIVTTEGGQRVMANLRRKSELTDKMFDMLVCHMNDRHHVSRPYEPTKEIVFPTWLQSN